MGISHAASRVSHASDFIFVRGYVFSREPLNTIPAGFRTMTLPDGNYFRHDPILPTHLACKQGNYILLAGYAIDILTATDAGESIAFALLSALCRSESAFFDRLDDLCGRFIVVSSLEGNIRALSDATAMKSIFYDPKRPGVIVSHPRMLAIAWNDGGIPFMYGFPGLNTPVPPVKILSPNTLLKLSDNSVVRFFPRSNIEPASPDEVVSRILSDCRMQLPLMLGSYGSVLMSLTAGIDSRLTLACVKPWVNRIRFFTYFHTWRGQAEWRRQAEIEAGDRIISALIAQRIGLDHILFDRFETPVSQADFDALATGLHENCYEVSAKPLLNYWYWQRFASPKGVHLRSNLAEIGRCFWRESRRAEGIKFDASTMTSTYQQSLMKPLTELQFAQTTAMFDEFAKVTVFDDIYNYDPYDLFYWEHRMGTWHAQFCMQSDPAFESHVIFNARRILKAMLSIQVEHRVAAQVFHTIIANELPELTDLPINPHVDLATSFGVCP